MGSNLDLVALYLGLANTECLLGLLDLRLLLLDLILEVADHDLGLGLVLAESRRLSLPNQIAETYTLVVEPVFELLAQ